MIKTEGQEFQFGEVANSGGISPLNAEGDCCRHYDLAGVHGYEQ